MDMKQLIATVAELSARIAALEEQLTKLQPRDRGPKSEKEMTEADAFRVKFGDLKDKKHKEAATELGLSYGQIFSCRGGYTFKQVTKDWKPTKAEEPKTAEVTK